MVLARLLPPSDFGLVAMATAVTGVFGLFKDAGLSMVTVQRPYLTDEHVSTLFWLNMLIGAVLAAACLGVGPVLWSFYGERRLVGITAILAIGFVFNAAGVQHSALLQRRMRFGVLSAIDVVSQFGSAAVGIGLAVSGFGLWSLVIMAVVAPTCTTFCLWFALSWVPSAPRRLRELGEMLRFGGTTALNGLVMYIAYNSEKVLLGRVWGAEALGLYGRAYQLVNIPAENLNAAAGGILFSGLSRLQDNRSHYASYFAKAYGLAWSLALPCTLACALFADDLVLVLLGPKWEAAAPMFRLLSPAVLALALINPLYWLLISSGMAARSLKVALVMAPCVVGAYLVGLPYGPTGVATAYSAVMIALAGPVIAWCIHGTPVSPQHLVISVVRPIVSVLIAAGVVSCVQAWLPVYEPAFLRLSISSGLFVAVYAWMLLYVMGQKEFYRGLVRALR